MSNTWTIPTMAQPTVPIFGDGIVFQACSTSEQCPVLAFSMTLPSYLRRRLRTLIQYEFSFF